MLSFKVPHNPTIYHFFIDGKDAVRSGLLRQLLSSILQKPIVTMAKQRIERTVKRFVAFDPPSVRFIASEIRCKNLSAIDTVAFDVVGQKHCLAYFRDVYDSFTTTSQAAFDHIGADLYVIEKYARRTE